MGIALESLSKVYSSPPFYDSDKFADAIIAVCRKFFPLIPLPPTGGEVRVRGGEKTFGHGYMDSKLIPKKDQSNDY